MPQKFQNIGEFYKFAPENEDFQRSTSHMSIIPSQRDLYFPLQNSSMALKGWKKIIASKVPPAAGIWLHEKKKHVQVQWNFPENWPRPDPLEMEMAYRNRNFRLQIITN